jgi:hypothetical protein
MHFRHKCAKQFSVTASVDVIHGSSSGDDDSDALFKKRYRFLIDGDAVPHAVQRRRINMIISVEEEPGEEDVDAYEHALLCCDAEYKGRYFIFLMTHAMNSKTDSFVGYTLNPILDVIRHNDKTYFDRNTCMAAPHWILDIVMGPFICKEVAIDCARALVNGTRGKEAKRNKAPYLSTLYNVSLYRYNEKLQEPLDQVLRENAPPKFIDILREMNK